MAISTETLHAKKRTANGTRACRELRAGGEVPAVVYGHGQDAAAIQVAQEALVTALRRRTRMFDLAVDDARETVLLQEVQYDALGSHIVHADFLRVAMDEKVTLEVTLTLKGQPKVEHAVLQQTLNTLEVECLPGDIPEAIIVKVAHLQLGDTVKVGELELPAGVTAVTDPEVVVAALTAAAAEVSAEAAAPEGAAAEPELIGRKPAEEGEEEGADEKPKKDKEK